MRLDTHRLQTLDQVREFLAGSAGLALQPHRRADAYALVATTVQRFDYALCGKPDKGLLRRFLSQATGLSRAQVTRLLRQHRTTGAVTDRRGAPRRPFARRYTRADIGLLAETDALHGTLSGPATRALCARAWRLFGDGRFERLARISNGHLYRAVAGVWALIGLLVGLWSGLRRLWTRFRPHAARIGALSRCRPPQPAI